MSRLRLLAFVLAAVAAWLSMAVLDPRAEDQ
jgi:hypothetical protein